MGRKGWGCGEGGEHGMPGPGRAPGRDRSRGTGEGMGRAKRARAVRACTGGELRGGGRRIKLDRSLLRGAPEGGEELSVIEGEGLVGGISEKRILEGRL